MMPSNPPSTSTGASGQGNRITASLVQPSGQKTFQLTYRGEAIPLVDSGSLNRWAAIGVVDRHNIAVLSDGVSIDGRKISYSDPNATADLERILNRPEAPHPRTTPGVAGRSAHTAAPAITVSEASALASLVDSVHVSRDGFEYHVTYRTRFGENKTEKLAPALEAFQNMRIFKPHVNLQKSGIRLVVTRWDGESFVEEPGIENLEHVTPEQVEALIRANLQGAPDAQGPTVATHVPSARRRVARVEVVKKPHDARFHLLYHYVDGTREEGPLLIRANMAKLAGSGIFQPDVSLSMTALNDRVVITGASGAGEQAGPRTESFPLNSMEQAQLLEAALNRFLHACDEPELPAPALAAPVLTPLTAVAPEPKPALPAEPPAALKPPAPVLPQRPVTAQAPAATALAPTPPQEQAKPTAKDWIVAAVRAAEAMPPEQINESAFHAVRLKFGQSLVENDHGLPEFSVEWNAKDGSLTRMELVLAPHYLLCTYPFGYLRFGTETRIYLNRLDDYIAFPQHALRGVGEIESGITLVVAEALVEFLRKNGDRSYRAAFEDVVVSATQLHALQDLIWPCSPEEQLFNTLTTTAQSYGLPVTADSIVLDANASEFIGFKRIPPHAIEFREGADFIRFAPEEIELREQGEEHRFTASGVLRGWALDSEGRVAALYRPCSGFAPPEEIELLRFIPEEKRQQESLNVLAELPG